MAYLHLGAEHGVVAGQFGAVDGVWRGGGGAGLGQLQQRLHVCAVLIGQGLLVLVRPLADPRLPALRRVLVQRIRLRRGVLKCRQTTVSVFEHICFRVFVFKFVLF